MARLDPEQVRRVLVMRALPGLGDALTIVPALRALRRGLPDAEITFLGLDQVRWVAERYPYYVDDFVAFPGYPGLPERQPDVRALPGFFQSLQQRRFDVAFQWHGSGITTNPVVALVGARCTAGFFLPGQYCPDERGFLEWDGHEHETLRYLRLLTHLGVAADDPRSEFPVRDDDERRLDALLGDRAAAPLAVLHPGTNQVGRDWPVASFALVADALAEGGLLPVLTGTAGERATVAGISAGIRADHLDLAGRTELGVLAALVQRAKLVVAPDTGVAHLAGAVGTPSVVLFRSSDAGRWGPLDRSRHRVLGLDEPLARASLARPGNGRCLGDGCRRVPLDVADIADGADVPASSVTPEDVLREAQRLLAAGS